MPNKLYISPLNPVKFHENDPTTLPQYLSKFFDSVPYLETIEAWEQYQPFCQPFQTTDAIHIQVQSDYAPLKIEIINSRGRIFETNTLNQVAQNELEPTMFVYETSFDLAAYEEGQYFLRMQCGNPVSQTLISEPIFIREVHENSILLEYTNPRFYADWIFETGLEPSIRVLGKIRYKQPASKDTFYEDQVLNMTLLNSVPFRIWELILSSSFGIPNYLIDKLNYVLGCKTITIDGRGFTKNEGAKLEEKAIEEYPLRGWSIEMRESRNVARKTFDNDGINLGPDSFVVSVASKGFSINDEGEENIIDIN
jgi:hypothetical protein